MVTSMDLKVKQKFWWISRPEIQVHSEADEIGGPQMSGLQ